ncbi:MAG: PAS domain S-box protein [Flavisolibacter sp.]
MLTDFKLLVQSITEAVFLLDKDGYINFSNLAATRLTGFSSEELINKPYSLFAEQNEENSFKGDYALEQARKKGYWEAEGWLYKKEGERYWAEINLNSVRNDRSELMGYTLSIKDRSEKKKTELLLRETEQRYRLMVEGVKEYMIILLDANGNISSWNEGANRIMGYHESEVIGKHFSMFYTREDYDSKKWERELNTAATEGKFEEEQWRVRKNGSLFWANVVVTALFNEYNDLVGFSKVTRDLSDKREKDEALRQSEERNRLLIEQVKDYGIFMLDDKGRIVSWNEGAKRIKGYTEEEIIGKYFSIFYTEEDIRNGKPPYELKVARKEGKYEEEGWRVRKDGSLFWANVVITAIYNKERALIGFAKVTRDLTERKESEKALKDSYQSYRRLAIELKATNEQLMHANEELEQFTSIVSHDLQEPVRTIKSFLQLIQIKLSASQDEDLKNYIQKAVNSSNRMKELILNLLHYSQLGKDELSTEDVNVQDLFQEAISNLKGSIEAGNAQIIIENELEYIRGNRVQLVQLIQNLLSNALKFTHNNEPKINIRCTKENGEVIFSISDNGIGIAKGDLNKIFEIFRRLNHDRDFAGTGIGLAICKKIVDRHRGRIWPESEPGKGTTFYFTINTESESAQTA